MLGTCIISRLLGLTTFCVEGLLKTLKKFTILKTLT